MKNFIFIIGAPKCGTSAVFDLISTSSLVKNAMIKEPMFFCEKKHYKTHGLNNINRMIITNKKDYLSNFGSEGKYSVDASTEYLSDDKALEKLSKECVNPKIIIILRNPFERIKSEIKHLKRDRYLKSKKISIQAHIDKQKYYIDNCYNPLFYSLKRSLYSKHVKAYLEKFGKQNVLILNYEELKSNPRNIVVKLNKFLKIDIEINQLKISNNSNAIQRLYLNHFQRKLNFLLPILNFLKIKKITRKIWYQLKEVNLLGTNKSFEKEIEEDYNLKTIQMINKDIDELRKLISFNVTPWKR